jgi:hypothetical protein
MPISLIPSPWADLPGTIDTCQSKPGPDKEDGRFIVSAWRPSAVEAPKPPDALPASEKKGDWRVTCRPTGNCCVFRPEWVLPETTTKTSVLSLENGQPLALKDISGAAEVSSAFFDFVKLPSDVWPLICRYVQDCELLRLSATSKSLYRAIYPEFAFRASKIITSLPVDKCRPRKTIAEAHLSMETLAIALKESKLFHVKVDYSKGFPRAVCAPARNSGGPKGV